MPWSGMTSASYSAILRCFTMLYSASGTDGSVAKNDKRIGATSGADVRRFNAAFSAWSMRIKRKP